VLQVMERRKAPRRRVSAGDASRNMIDRNGYQANRRAAPRDRLGLGAIDKFLYPVTFFLDRPDCI